MQTTLRGAGRSAIAGLLALTASLGAVAAGAAPAEAAGPRPDFQLPFPCGQQWELDTRGHAPALDMMRDPDRGPTDGSLLIAPAGGTVNQSFLHPNAGNTIQIDHGGGWFTTYIHLRSRTAGVGDRVAQGQEIGRVGETGETSNGTPHLHFEMAVDANGDGEASWGRVESERVPAWFGGVEYARAVGRDVRSANCGTAPAATVTGSLQDFTGDGHADLLARRGDGLLFRYDGTGTGYFSAAGTQIGGGWNPYTAIVPTQDLTGDGRADLVARRSDGLLFRYDGTGTGFFAAQGSQIGGGWNDVTAIVSPGDTDSDGRPDLIARRSDGLLFRYSGTGTGFFAASGTRIGGGWTEYTALVGGDLNGDRRGDLIARDPAGLLWRYLGTGTGYLQNTRTQIGGGWNPFTAIG